jgi:hypothetical protein
LDTARITFEQQSLFLFSKQGKQQGQEDTDDNARNDGKVKSDVLLSDDDISGESADPGNFLPDQ